MSDIKKIKQLREMTGAGFKDCNAAIKETAGDIEKAIEKFVDFIKVDLKPEPSDNSGTTNIKNAESLFKSLGDLDYSLEIDENLILDSFDFYSN